MTPCAMSTPAREGETIEGSRTMRNRHPIQCSSAQEECGASSRPPLGVRLFLSLFAVSSRFSLQPSCHLAVVPLSSFFPLSLEFGETARASFPVWAVSGQVLPPSCAPRMLGAELGG